LTVLLALDVYSLVRRKALRLLGGHETAHAMLRDHPESHLGIVIRGR